MSAKKVSPWTHERDAYVTQCTKNGIRAKEALVSLAALPGGVLTYHAVATRLRERAMASGNGRPVRFPLAWSPERLALLAKCVEQGTQPKAAWMLINALPGMQLARNTVLKRMAELRQQTEVVRPIVTAEPPAPKAEPVPRRVYLPAALPEQPLPLLPRRPRDWGGEMRLGREA